MAGNDDLLDQLLKADVDKTASLDAKKKEIEANRIEIQYERMVEGKERHDAIKQSKFGIISRERAEELAKESTDYFTSARKQFRFINKAFDGRIPLHEKNLILVGAYSGDGKTTCMANAVFGMMMQRNPNTGEVPRILVITNEESVVDFYNRITCLIKGWHYVNHESFTDEQIKTFAEYIKILSQRITIIDDQFSSNGRTLTGATSTPEGYEIIFSNLLADKEIYDAVFIDYYQGVNESTKDTTLDEYKCQRKLTQILEKYRKSYPCPIILFCQIEKPDEDDRVPFMRRIQGTKLIFTRCTMAMEIRKHPDEKYTEFIIRKGRFAELGTSIEVGYKNGLLVPRDDAFKAAVNAKREREEDEALNKQIGIKVGEPVNG